MAYVSQTDLERAVLYRLFSYVQNNSKRLRSQEVADLFDTSFSAKRVQLAVEALNDEELVTVGYASSGMSCEINRTGYSRVEQELTDKLSFSAQYAKYGDSWLTKEPGELFGAPAADRIVPLNHNQAEFQEIGEQLQQLAVAVSGDNELDENLRGRFSASLGAAVKLWEATELKAIQLKIGVVMAVEDIKPYAKSKFYEGLIDGLLALFRIILSSAGIKLSNF